MRKKRLPGGRGNKEYKRNRAIYELRKQGETLPQIAEVFGLSHQRIAQIVGKIREEESGDKVLHKV